MAETRQNATLDIFLSYSSEDRNLSMRLYEDLTRSGFSVWRYEKDGIPGADFLIEIEARIKEARVFCLIDSVAARMAAGVSHEVNLAWQRYINGLIKHFVICLAQEDGAWRKNASQKPCFAEINTIRYFDFNWSTQGDVFDPYDRYRSTMIQLVDYLGKKFIPSTPIPWIESFQDELYNFRKNLPINEQELLLKDYSIFYYYYSIHQYDRAERRIKLILAEWNKLQLISPLIAYGTLLFEMGEVRKTHRVFKEIKLLRPSNPIGWWGGGICQYYLGNLDSALQNFDESLLLIDQTNPHHLSILPNIWNYKLYTIIGLRGVSEAVKMWHELPPHLKASIELKLVLVWIQIKQDFINQAYESYQNLAYLVQNPERNSPVINESLAMLELFFSEWYIQKDQFEKTREHLENRVKLLPNNIRAWAELASLYSTNKKYANDMRLALSKGLKLNPITQEDHYFLGLMYYLDKKRLLAKESYDKSKNLGWDYYSTLMEAEE